MTPSDPPTSQTKASEDRGEENRISVELMMKVKEDQDMEAFEQLVDLHKTAVVGTVAKMLGSPNDAEDIAQQVFVRIWKSASRYQPTAKFTTWMFTITRNLVFNEVRRRQRKPVYSLEEREEESHVTTADLQTSTPDESALHTELEEAINQAIQNLPEKQRTAVILRRYEESPYEEIAQVLGMSVSAVKSLLFRARTQLKEDLEKYLRA